MKRKRSERADGAEAVAPRDLLAFGVGAAVVGDRHLVEADVRAEAQDLRGQLGLDPEVVGDQVQAADEVAAERLVADLHVGDRRVVEHVGQQRQEAVAGVVPEQVRALRVRAAAQAGAEDGVGLAGQQRVDQRRDVRRRVLEVGVLDQQDVAAGLVDPAPDRRALAAVARLREHLDLRRARPRAARARPASRPWSRRRRAGPRAAAAARAAPRRPGRRSLASL